MASEPPSTTSAWGDKQTQLFYQLTPERILDAVEAAGFRSTGRCLALNSLENRVYQIELAGMEEADNPSDRFLVAKFYRPGRWSRDQILDEHDFLMDLEEAELPVIAPVDLPDGGTLGQDPDTEIWFALFPMRGGRIPDELDDEKARRLGRLIARVHNVGAEFDAEYRIELTADIYGRRNLQTILELELLPGDIRSDYVQVVEQICDETDQRMDGVPFQRIHGDCHLGNLLWRPDHGFQLLDFDDMVNGPCVQDLWLLAAGRDGYARELQQEIRGAYQEFREFDTSTLALIEPLRALRFVHFSAWIASRTDDPAFQNIFPEFGTEQYWIGQLTDLREQLHIIRGGEAWS